MLIKSKEFYKKNPIFEFPKDLDDPLIDNLRRYVYQEQITSTTEEIKCRWMVPFEDDNGILKPHWSSSRWYRKQPNYREVSNHCFFSAFQFSHLTSQGSNKFIDLDGDPAYMFNGELNEIIKNNYLLENGWIIGKFAYVKRGSELGLRPYNPSKDKLTGKDPFANVQTSGSTA